MIISRTRYHAAQTEPVGKTFLSIADRSWHCRVRFSGPVTSSSTEITGPLTRTLRRLPLVTVQYPYFVLLFAIAVAFVCVGSAMAEQVPPILEPHSLVLVRVDLKQVDVPALQKWISDRIGESKLDPSARQQFAVQMQSALTELMALKDGLSHAGVQVGYASIGSDQIFDPTPLVWAQLSAGGNVQAVRSLLYSGKADGPVGPDPDSSPARDRVTASLGNGVFLGSVGAYRQIKQNNPGNAELAQMLSSAPPAPVQLVVAVPADSAKAFEQMLPQLPAPSNAPTTILTQGVRRATLTLQLPPNPSARLSIESQDAKAAENLKNWLEGLPQAMHNESDADMIKQTLAASSMQLQDDRLVVDLSADQLRSMFAGPVLSGAYAARQRAALMVSMSKMKQILVAMYMYADRNHDQLPDNLEQLSQFLHPEVLNDPRSAGGKGKFIYVKPAERFKGIAEPATTPLLFESLDDLPPGITAVAVGFADGHVEARNREQVQRMLPKK